VATRVTSSRFIGRTDELAELLEPLSGDGSELPALAFVAGESGVGKSRLLTELIEHAQERGLRVLGGPCIELGDDELPFAPLTAALRPLVRGDDPILSEISDAGRAELARLVPELGQAPADSSDADRVDSQRLFDAVLELIAAMGAESPRGVLLWIEDIHWADSSTRSFLRFLGASVRDEPLLTVLTYRSDELHRRHPLRPLLGELERTPRAIRVELSRFDRDELADQVADILGEAPDGKVIDRMHARSDGNPLFTEELLAAGADGRGALPPSLREALLLRVERLPDAAQRLLRLLAVVGRAGHNLLAEAAGVDPGELSSTMREAVEAQIVVTDGEGRFAFRHALLREVLYDDLLPGEQAELHLALAKALERMRGGHDEAWIITGIAHHYNAAGDQPAALKAAVEAAEEVSRLQAFHEAAALLDRAVALWPRVAEPEALTGIDHPEILMRCARAHYLWGDDEVAIGLYEHAVGEIDADTDCERAAMALYRLATCEWSLGRAERSRATQRRALDLLANDPASPARAQLLAQKVRFLLLQGRYREVVEEAPQALEAIGLSGYEHARAGVVNRLALALFALGEEEEASTRLQDSIELAESGRDPDDVATVYLNYADALLLAGRGREALAAAQQGITKVQELIDDRAFFRALGWIRINIAEIAFPLGDWKLAQAELDAAGEKVAGIARASAKLQLAQLLLGREADSEAARAPIDEACTLLRDSLEPQYIGLLASLEAELERRQGRLDAARAAATRGIDRIQFCSEDGARIALIATAGLAVEADAAVRACDVADDDACDAARARAEFLAELVEAAAEESPRPLELAYAAQARAELARAQGEDDPRLWQEAADAWAAIENPYPRAIALWRKAQAELERSGRQAATASLAEAHSIAASLGSRWLLGEIEGLASRARLNLNAAETNGDQPEPEPVPFDLTRRELQVLELLVAGCTNREIGESLFMAEKTASVHVSRILTKLDVRSRTEAAAVAHRHGIGAEVDLAAGA
jgi:DNA-binding CsgD family transcriptional regulator/tetratricopeptide (TPR) repeat protein